MTFEQFNASLSEKLPPDGIAPTLKSLWYAGKGNWEKAHDIAQDILTREGSWVHAYLHRVEGDEQNARYWYIRAGREAPTETLEEEWAGMVTTMLSSAG